MVSAVAAVAIWLTVILAPDGSYTGQSYVSDNEQECSQAVAGARIFMTRTGYDKQGYTVTDCAPMFGGGVAIEGLQAP